MVENIAVIGLGYVGLPVAVGMARAHGAVVGFDVDPVRIAALRDGTRRHGRIPARRACGRYRPAIPPIRRILPAAPASSSPCRPRSTRNGSPTCRRCCAAPAGRVGAALQAAAIVVVYEMHCLSGRDRGGLRAAPGERIGPGLKAWTSSSATRPSASIPATARIGSTTIMKVIVRRRRPKPLEIVDAVYGSGRQGRARTGRRSIRVAEAAKVIENTQRDVNIAL